MDLASVEKSYARWAPVYDRTFGSLTRAGRRRAVRYLNRRGGRVLEVGVGTGLSLPYYGEGLEVSAIDFSAEMLAKARARVTARGLDHVAQLRRMDARQLDFPDETFDSVAAMHVLSVVPEPERVVAEIARVLKPGGQLVVTNHFRHETGVYAALARATAPFADKIGWHSDFDIGTVLAEPRLAEVTRTRLPPLGLMTFLVLEKRA